MCLVAASTALMSILLIHGGQYPRSAAIPPPNPPGFVGVPTLTKINSASQIAASTSGLKKRFLFRTDWITSNNSGSNIGSEDEFHASIRAAFESTTVTLMCGFFSAIMAHVGAPILVNTNVKCIEYRHSPHRCRRHE